MVDGKAFHVMGEKGKSMGKGSHIKVVPLDEEKGRFEWFYKGETVNRATKARELIEVLNE